MTDFEWLQNWYHSHCDGDWEHDRRIAILSNKTAPPTWSIEINFEGTSLEDKKFTNVDTKDGNSWIHCSIDGNDFHATCSPDQLEEVIRIFRSWAEENS